MQQQQQQQQGDCTGNKCRNQHKHNLRTIETSRKGVLQCDDCGNVNNLNREICSQTHLSSKSSHLLGMPVMTCPTEQANQYR